MGQSPISDSWNFNLTTLELDGGKRWFERVVEHSDRDEFTRGVATHAVSNDWFREHGIVPETKLDLPQNIYSFKEPTDCIRSVLCYAHPAFMKEYPRHVLAARRFASNPGLHIGPVYYSLDDFPGRIGLAEGIVNGAKSYLARSNKVALLKPGENMALDLYTLMSAYAIPADSAFPKMEETYPTSGRASRFGFLNVEHGLLALFKLGGPERMAHETMEEEIKTAFYGYLPHLTPFTVSYDVPSQSLQVFFSRRDPSITFFEDFATLVRVKPTDVKVTLPADKLASGESGIRSADLPLTFKYASGARQRGWPDPKQLALFRVEADYATGADPQAILGSLKNVAREHDAGARIFLQTFGNIIEIAHDMPISETVDFSGGELDIFTMGPGAASLLAGAVTALGPIAAAV